MNCNQIDRLISRFVDGDLDESLRMAVAEHLRECGACARKLAELEEIASVARRIDMAEPPTDLRARIAAAIEDVDSVQGPTSSLAARIRSLLRPAPVRLAGAAIAAAVALVIVTGWPVSNPEARKPRPEIVKPPAAVSNSADPAFKASHEGHGPEVAKEVGSSPMPERNRSVRVVRAYRSAARPENRPARQRAPVSAPEADVEETSDVSVTQPEENFDEGSGADIPEDDPAETAAESPTKPNPTDLIVASVPPPSAEETQTMLRRVKEEAELRRMNRQGGIRLLSARF